MKTIYKYEICTVPELVAGYKNGKTLELPENSKILRCEIQQNNVCVWVELDKEREEKEQLHVVLFGTGWEFSGVYQYVNSIFVHSGTFVYHAYYRK